MNSKLKFGGTMSPIAVLLCVMLSVVVWADDGGYRTFSDKQGRTFKGRLLDYEAATETVVVKRHDAIKSGIPLDRFSEADRIYILDWGAERCFQEELELVPSLSSIAVSKKESRISDYTKREFDVFYEIRFISASGASLEKLEFEYCIFYNQGEREGRTVQYEEGICYGAGVVEGLDPASEHVSKTKPIRLYTGGGRVGLFGNDFYSLANVRGIWLRLKTRLPSGREIEREYRTSDDELWEWSVYSFGAGLNEGAKKQIYYYDK